MAAVLPCDSLFFVFDELAIKFVDKGINRGVHILCACVGKKFSAGNVRSRFGQVLDFFNAEDNVHLRNVVVVAINFPKFLVYIFVEGISEFDVLSRDT